MQRFPAKSLGVFFSLFLLLAPGHRAGGDDSEGAKPKPKVAVFPLGGTSADKLREKVTRSMRMKLDRDTIYEPIDGPAMADMAAAAKDPLSADTTPDILKELASDTGAVVLLWGDLSPGDGGNVLRLKVLDLREKDAAPKPFTRTISDVQDIRFAVEEALRTVPGVGDFEHPNEIAVRHDPEGDAAFARNPNLVVNGTFAQPGHWDGIYQSEKYAVALSDTPPEVDKISIYRLPAGAGDGETAHNVLAMNLSLNCAQNNGLACLSDAIAIQPGVRYRVRFRYKSDGPVLHVFIKGYTTGKNLAGEKADREVYRRQVPPSGGTDGKWVTVEDDLNPQHIHFPVERLRIDLYAYLGAGTVMFDDVQLKAVGKQRAEDIGKDAAIKAPTTRQLKEEGAR